APGNTCTVTVQFRPGTNTTGLKTATLSITDSGGTATDALSGTVVANVLTFSAPTPSLVTGTTTSHSGVVTITNSGTATFTFSGFAVNKVGTAGGTFSIAGGGGAGPGCTATTALAGGAGCTVTLTYAPPGTTTTATANVSVTGTGAPSPQVSANFTAN